MLWYTGSLLLVLWFVLKFVLHKGGAVHILLFLVISFYLVQLAQDRRTRQYQRSLEK
jgi:1,4-dihydroxy-2-naphthoate octaprenyltransferase